LTPSPPAGEGQGGGSTSSACPCRITLDAIRRNEKADPLLEPALARRATRVNSGLVKGGRGSGPPSPNRGSVNAHSPYSSRAGARSGARVLVVASAACRR
jgi:hypothetical protein